MSGSPDSPASLFSLAGKTAVVVGGTGELCGAMALGMARFGAEVVLVGRDETKAAAKLDVLAAEGLKGYFVSADTTSKAGLEHLRDTVVAKSGACHILVNGAGTNSPTPFLDITEEEFDRIVNVNIKGVLLGCQVFGGYFLDKGIRGSIINLGSMSGVLPLSRVFTYSLTKAAVHNLSKNLAREWAPQGIRVNTLVPGFFPAEQNRRILNPSRVESILGHTPMGRFGEAGELVGATVLLASDNAGSFITGSEIIVDGGFSAMSI
jgi:NAD(P)-dependent dehydrogenase (short-subunit alcohol dehydrogenase family)